MRTRVLTVTTPYWSARCRWVYRYGKWEVVILDKELNFLKGMNLDQAKAELMELQAEWGWSPIVDEPAPSVTG
jgi:hypothetical protein